MKAFILTVVDTVGLSPALRAVFEQELGDGFALPWPHAHLPRVGESFAFTSVFRNEGVVDNVTYFYIDGKPFATVLVKSKKGESLTLDDNGLYELVKLGATREEGGKSIADLLEKYELPTTWAQWEKYIAKAA